MSEIKFPDNWWTAGAVKAWELDDNSGSRWRKLPDGRIELGYIDCEWVESIKSEQGLDSGVGGVIAVPVIPISDWAAGYDRAAVSSNTRSREGGGIYEWTTSNGKTWKNSPGSCRRDIECNGYTPVPTVLGGWREPVPVLPAPEPTPQPEVNRADLELCRGLLHRIRAWDQLPTTGDGPFWIGEINQVLGNTDPGVEDQVVACADRRDRPCPDVTPNECVGWSHVYWHRNGAHRFALAGTRWVAECRYKLNPEWNTTGWAGPDEFKASAAINPDLADGFRVVKEPQADRLTRTEFLSLVLGCVSQPGGRFKYATENLLEAEPAIVAALKGRRP